MDEDPDFVFACSSAQQFACMRIHSIFRLFEYMKRRIGNIFHNRVVWEQIEVLEHETETLFCLLQHLFRSICRMARIVVLSNNQVTECKASCIKRLQ